MFLNNHVHKLDLRRLPCLLGTFLTRSTTPFPSAPPTHTPTHHPIRSSPLVSKLGGTIGIPFFNAPTIPSLSNNCLISSSESTLVFTLAYAMRDGLSTTERNFCRRASDQDKRSRAESDASWDKTRVRTSAREEASAIPEARPRPA